MLKFGSEEALEVVFNDEDAEKIGIALGANDVPGERSHAEAADGHGVKAAKGVAPALGEDSPQKHRATGENDRRWPFRECGKAEEATEKKGGKEVEEVKEVKDGNKRCWLACAPDIWGIMPRRRAANTMAMVSMAANGMSVAAAWEKPIMPTVVGSKTSSQRAVSAP